VMARKSAVPTDDIPAVTQLFTPHWIVRYLVENSLGRLWMLNHPDSRLQERMPYYIDPVSDEALAVGSLDADISAPNPRLAPSGSQPNAERDFLKIDKPEEIRLLDPACGSGHMLTYAYDLLYAIYDEQGYAPTEIPGLILKHNLVGIEICDRAAALAAFALCMKARSSDSRYFRRVVQPNVISLQNIHIENAEVQDYVDSLGLGDLFNQPLLKLLHQFEEAKNFGSLIQPCLSEVEIQSARSQIENPKSKIENSDLFIASTHRKVLRVLEQAEALTQRYHCVVLNPPYLNRLNGSLKTFVDTHYEQYKSDLFAAFAIRAKTLTKSGGLVGITTPNVWMYIKSHFELRKELLTKSTLRSLVELSLTGFSGATVQLCAYVFENEIANPRAQGSFIRLVNFKRENEMAIKALEAIQHPDCKWIYSACAQDFTKIPGNPIAYWLGEKARNSFRLFDDLSKHGEPRLGMATGNNETYVRLWQEVSLQTIGFGFTTRVAARNASDKIWFPYNKGGAFRRWYGNNEHVVNWHNDGHLLRNTMHPDGARIWAHNFNLDYIFKPCLTFTATSSSYFGIRYSPDGFLFDNKGSSYFAEPKKLNPILGFLGSEVASYLLKAINPTVEFQPGNISVLPFNDETVTDDCGQTVGLLVELSRADWDNFETSWDFRDQPLLRPGLKGATLEASWRNWEAQSTAAIRRMQELETENNRLFIAAYGLDSELEPEVPEAQITLAHADARRDMAAFLSYAVGCMMGRYSLDQPGLILANAGDTIENFRLRILDFGLNVDAVSFMPDSDGVIPILEGEWFEDDVTDRFKQFLKTTFGTEHFEENVQFVESSLGKSLRKYFLNDFYKDHLQTYKKRPIYWLFSSPKGTFNALIYMHRYRTETVGTVLQYLRDFRDKLAHHAEHRQMIADSASESKTVKTQAIKEVAAIKKQLKELEDYEKTLFEVAARKIEVDLDNGVKHNYPLFGPVLRKIPGLEILD
ncbi:MAG: BREX-1 system adenine-specific DNA-methyltransferase PglX, partial [Pirellulaceae bacterium]|nr:BREX-1 system adenine-specific DNA-methyltransferase PglX [Pirellulaceae bacterium]